jgi:hypothetical protein
MFCPTCGAEYREGYVNCTDCRVALVPELPADWNKADSWSPLPPKKFLLWFVPLSFVFPFVLLIVPTLFGRGNFNLLFWFVDCVCTVSSFGSLWMIYQAIRYEERVKSWILLAFVPFMFIWYRLIRYPVRPKLVRAEEQSGTDSSA